MFKVRNVSFYRVVRIKSEIFTDMKHLGNFPTGQRNLKLSADHRNFEDHGK
jgi:hypothetical protein